MVCTISFDNLSAHGASSKQVNMLLQRAVSNVMQNSYTNLVKTISISGAVWSTALVVIRRPMKLT